MRDTELHQFSGNKLHTADLEIPERALTWYTLEHKRVQKDFQRAKMELCNASGLVWSQILSHRIEGEMDRLTNKLWEIKSTKIRNLEQEPQQRKEIIDRNSDSNQDKVKHCRVERSKKRKRRKRKRNKERQEHRKSCREEDDNKGKPRNGLKFLVQQWKWKRRYRRKDRLIVQVLIGHRHN